MNFQWMSVATACPIVEFHDVRTENAGISHYLTVMDGLGGALTAAGAHDLGRFAVHGHPDRLLMLRGYETMAARRQSMGAFHASPDWQSRRESAVGLRRSVEISLTRTVTPEAGLKPVRRGVPLAAFRSELRYPEQIGSYHLWLRLWLRKAGLDPLAAFATLEAVNDVPAVPVVRNRVEHIALLPAIGPVPELPPELRAMLRYRPETLVLEPAAALAW